MDWKQFIASVVGSLAWPVVVLIFLWVIRRRIGGLLSRVIELHLPGGAKAIFAQELDKGRDVIEAIGDGELEKVYFKTLEGREERAHENVPHCVIVQTYNELETELFKAREPLGLSTRMNAYSIIKSLIQRDVLDSEASALFETLRRARNAIVHAPTQEVTDPEAMEYAAQAEFLTELVKDAIKKLTRPKQGQ
jgi:hypothetical protein